MTKEEVINLIVEIEWDMFHTVNGEKRVSCQDDYHTFLGMRSAQYSVWSVETCKSWYRDIKAAADTGRNLPREKYIYMMKSTAPDGFEYFSKELPALTDEKQKLVADIWAVLLRQTEKLREKYPLIALGGRPLHAADEHSGLTSIETYQTSELLTYSEDTLKLLYSDIIALQNDGREYAFIVQENSVKAAGYKSMEQAEEMMLAAARKKLEKEIDAVLAENTGCKNCRLPGQI